MNTKLTNSIIIVISILGDIRIMVTDINNVFFHSDLDFENYMKLSISLILSSTEPCCIEFKWTGNLRQLK